MALPGLPLLLRPLPRRLGARRGTCARVMTPPRFAVELPDCTLAHFALGARGAGLGDPDGRPDPRLAALLGPPGRSYSLCVPIPAGGGCGPRVQAARMHQRLLLQLRRGPLQRRGLLRYGPGGQAGAVQHGFLLCDPGDHPDTRGSLLELLGSCPEAARPHLGEFEVDGQGLLWQRLWELQGDRPVQVDCARVLPAPGPQLHPVLPDLLNSVVFTDRDAARAVLEECTSFIPEAQKVLDLVDQCPKQIQKGKFKVVVIEGLDATGTGIAQPPMP